MSAKHISTGLLLIMVKLVGCAPSVTQIGPGFIYEPDEREQRLWTTSRELTHTIDSSGAIYDDSELESYVQSVMDRLLGEYQSAYAPLDPRVRIIDSEALNAFALPHGAVQIHTGMLGRLRNEAQLAMLLGHELTHSTHRHAFQKYEQAYGASGTYTYIAVLSGLAGSNVQQLMEGLSRLVTTAAITGYGRDKEAESDRMGLTLMAQAGYDPKEGGRVFERMLDAIPKQQRGWSFFYSSHPKMDERAKSCDKLIARLPAELLANATETGRGRYVAAALHLIHDEVERHITQGKYELAEETLLFLAEARPSDALTNALRGDLCRARGDADDKEQAIVEYLKAIELDSGCAAAHQGLGMLYAKDDQPSKAIEHLNAYLRFASDATDAGYVRKYIEHLQIGN